MDFLTTLKDRNEILFWFGLLNLLGAFLIFSLSFTKSIEFGNTNAWFKPLKFALSTTLLSWAMAWYVGYLPKGNDIIAFNWIFVSTLAFEVIYITYQASVGKGSHYNVATPLYSFLFSMMALAASIATLAVGYIGIKFFGPTIEPLPDYYLWAIRFGILLFVIFAFQGFAMGANMAHTVGASDGTKGIPFLNWSLSHGDLRIAHFVGMHALQILPLLAWFVLKDVKWTIAISILYGLLAVFVLWQALRGISIAKTLT